MNTRTTPVTMRMVLLLGLAGLTACASSGPSPSSATMGGPPGEAIIANGCDPGGGLRQSVLRDVNAARVSGPLCGQQKMEPTRQVTWSPLLARAAGKHSADMARRNFFDGRSPDGKRVDDRVKREGYVPRAVAENISGGDYTVDTVVSSWLGSERHCRNMMNPAFSEVGAACARQPGSTFGTYWTMVMGNRADPVRPAATASPSRVKAAATSGPRRAAKPKAKCGAGTPKKCR